MSDLRRDCHSMLLLLVFLANFYGVVCFDQLLPMQDCRLLQQLQPVQACWQVLLLCRGLVRVCDYCHCPRAREEGRGVGKEAPL